MFIGSLRELHAVIQEELDQHQACVKHGGNGNEIIGFHLALHWMRTVIEAAFKNQREMDNIANGNTGGIK